MTADRTPPRSSALERPRGLGALVHTDVEHVDLGEHEGRHLRARVEHRTVRVALGGGWTTSVTLGRRRATSVEVTRLAVPGYAERGPDGAPSGERYDVAIPRPADPWPRMAQRVAAVALAGWLAVRVANRLRGRRDGRGYEGALE